MKRPYRAYLRTFDGQVPYETKTITHDAEAALAAFTALVMRTDLDGQKLAAVLTRDNAQIAFHRFDRAPGYADYWRDRLDEIDMPAARAAGRPVTLDGAQVKKVMLDQPTITRATEIGKGNLSAGLREAVTKYTP